MFIHLALQKLTCIANIYDDIYIYERRYTYRSMIVTRFSTAINIISRGRVNIKIIKDNCFSGKRCYNQSTEEEKYAQKNSLESRDLDKI